MNNQDSFIDFLQHTTSQKEVSLVIAQDEPELKELRAVLDQKAFTQLVDHPEFFRYISTPSKIYFVIQNHMPKRIYDFIMQYPTGQVEIFDKNKMKAVVISPIYKDVAVVILMTKETLGNIQKSEFQILEKVGMTYQS